MLVNLFLNHFLFLVFLLIMSKEPGFLLLGTKLIVSELFFPFQPSILLLIQFEEDCMVLFVGIDRVLLTQVKRRDCSFGAEGILLYLFNHLFGKLGVGLLNQVYQLAK